MRRPGGRSVAGGLALIHVLAPALAATGCAPERDGLVAPPPCAAPRIAGFSVLPNATNVLSARVVASLHGADSVQVGYGTATVDSVTPAFAVRGDSSEALALGLLPSTTYAVRLVATNRCGTTTSDALPFTTGALPADLPAYMAVGRAPSPGYVVLAGGKYGLVIDNTGRVVWYHRFPNGPGLDFQAQPDGRYATRPASAADDAWIEVAVDGATTRTLGCAGGLAPRMHDLLAQPDGSYWLLCDEVRTLDLSAQGGARQARVLGTAVQRRGADGEVLFTWSPFEHLPVELGMLDAADRSAPIVNWTHGNALDLDVDGNLLVSFRNLSEVTKVDVRTGAVVWRLGGAHSDFTIASGESPPFVRQHGVRASGDGGVLLLDNLGHASGSRAERYAIDPAHRTARLIDTYGAAAGFVAQVGGTAQALPGGHTLVAFGSGAGMEEYDASGTVVWRLVGDPGYVFRAQRIRSLYHPGVGDPR